MQYKWVFQQDNVQLTKQNRKKQTNFISHKLQYIEKHDYPAGMTTSKLENMIVQHGWQNQNWKTWSSKIDDKIKIGKHNHPTWMTKSKLENMIIQHGWQNQNWKTWLSNMDGKIKIGKHDHPTWMTKSKLKNNVFNYKTRSEL